MYKCSDCKYGSAHETRWCRDIIGVCIKQSKYEPYEEFDPTPYISTPSVMPDEPILFRIEEEE